VAEQAGFRRNHSTCDQVFALATYTENGYQTNQKSGVVFLNLTMVYDTGRCATLILARGPVTNETATHSWWIVHSGCRRLWLWHCRCIDWSM